MQKRGKLITSAVLIIALISIVFTLFFGSVTGYQIKDINSFKSKPKLDCVDDDNNPLVKGGVTFNGVFYSDKCKTSDEHNWQGNNVEEMTCHPSLGVEAKVVACPESYPYCDYAKGACVESKEDCQDTDLKNDPSKFGSVLLFNLAGSRFRTIADHCVNANKIKEQTCNGKQLGKPIIKSCPKGKKCSGGRCK